MVGLVHYINGADSWLFGSQTCKKKKTHSLLTVSSLNAKRNIWWTLLLSQSNSEKMFLELSNDQYILFSFIFF